MATDKIPRPSRRQKHVQHPLALSAAEIQAQENHLTPHIKRAWSARVLAARCAEAPFVTLHREIGGQLLADRPRCFEDYLRLVRGLIGASAIIVSRPHAIL